MIDRTSLADSLRRFTTWLDSYGLDSQDQYDYWASTGGGKAKARYYESRRGVVAVAPYVFLETALPSTRAWFHPKSRFPIALAHYAMGYYNLFCATGQGEYKRRAESLLEELERQRCPGWKEYCWGYPFNWVTQGGVFPAGTPLITTTPYAYEAFLSGYELDGDTRKEDILRSIAEHAMNDLHDTPCSAGIAVSYSPREEDKSHVVNATAYRAFILTEAGHRFGRRDWLEAAEKNVRFVISAQNPDGSWYYTGDGSKSFIDNFHTCFDLKNLAKIERLNGDGRCTAAIDRGFAFYREHLLDERTLPIPFAVPPRLTLHKRELYDYAEGINLCLLLRERHPACDQVLEALVGDLLERWQKKDGSFRTREMLVGWNNVPYHRWAQSQLFRSLSLLLRSGAASPVKSSLAAVGR
jgi:hypothetical protein